MLKRKIAERFPDDIFCYNKGKYLIVHCSDINLCDYAVAILKEKELDKIMLEGHLVL